MIVIFCFFFNLDDTSKVLRSCEPQKFSDALTWSLLVVVALLSCVILLLTWSKLKKFVSKHKTPTPTPTAGKGVFPKKTFCVSIRLS